MKKQKGTPTGEKIRNFIEANRVKDRLIDRVSYASDAGFYQLIPEAVVHADGEEEISALLRFCKENKTPLVFRAGGSSLSGQSITDGILCNLSQHWKKCSPEQNGQFVRVQPGITGAMVNARLKPFSRKIGPDPSSISAAMMGGILSNNASGMCCGVASNSYHTTKFIRFILPDGKSYSTEKPEDYARFETESDQIAGKLTELRNRILQNPALNEKIRQRYLSKNTVGYSLNAFLDHEHPLDILARLLIGAEGTLAFISEAVMETIPEHKFKATGLLFFPDIYAACEAIIPLNDSGALMVELMDRASLKAVEDKEGMPAILASLPEEAAALLVEFQAESELQLSEMLELFDSFRPELSLLEEPEFTQEKGRQAFLWNVRKGLFPAVGAVRKSGTSVILEDIAFPLPVLGDAVKQLRNLFNKHQYDNAIIFGHARDGNLHFVVTQAFHNEEEVNRYANFMDDVVALVMQFGGTLKAEHGTGRNMAPFVETEWGPEAYAIMQELKYAIDPDNILNPGVILNSDPKAHLKNLKPMPAVEEEVDRCIECGYCEHACPSRELSASPRRRIVIRRALSDFQQKGDHHAVEEIVRDQHYEVMETCAVDGLCAAACPVDINTGDLVKRLRRENHSPFASKMALEIAQNFGFAESAARTILKTGHLVNRIFGANFMKNTSAAMRKAIPDFPVWPASMPHPPGKNSNNSTPDENPEILYFSSCINRTLGGDNQDNVTQKFISICNKAGIRIKHIDSENGLCCSQIFSSKGYSEAWKFTANKIVAKLWHESLEGKLPIVTDVSSCTFSFRNLHPVLNPENQKRYKQLLFPDMVELLYDRVLPKLPEVKKQESLLLHPVCSLHKMKAADKLQAIAQHFAQKVEMPLQGGCCGMAGDRGFLFPELTKSSAKASCNFLPENNGIIYSSTASCEIALSESLGLQAKSILTLIESAFQEEKV